MRKIFFSVATLTGTIVGVGFFSLPYLALKSGVLTILFYFLSLSVLVLIIHLMFGELAIATPDYNRLPGFVKHHLGKRTEKIAYFSNVGGTFGAILAYLIVGGELLSQIFNGKELGWTLFYFFVGSLLIFWGIRKISKIEFCGLILFFLILALAFFQLKGLIDFKNFSFSPDLSFQNLFLPYGPILFSLWGASLIPEIEEMLREKKKYLKWVIAGSMLITVFIYIFFIYLILGICGQNTSEFALSGLKHFLHPLFFKIFLFFGFLATFTSFITLGLTLKKIFWYDLKIEKNFSFLLTCFPPLVLYLAGVKNFIHVISVVGSVFLAIDGILILLMYLKYIQKKEIKVKIKNFLIGFLILILLGGILGEIFYFYKL
jgi:amino acid permease